MHFSPVIPVLLSALFLTALARPTYPRLLPNGNASATADSGITCTFLGHASCKPPLRNKFGEDFKSAGYKWTKELCEADSDGDGLKNGEELGDPCCEWTQGAAPLFTKGLSHPGDASQKAAGDKSCAAAKKQTAAAATTPSPKVTPKATSKATTTGDAMCFPADARVTTTEGEVRMDQLKVGDRVLVADGEFSDVYAFSHADAERVVTFVVIGTKGGKVLHASEGHFVYADGELVKAADVRVGAYMHDIAGNADVVVSVGRAQKRGLYNPHTLHGDVIVDGVRCSAYTAAVEPAPAAAALAPVRAAYKWARMAARAFARGVLPGMLPAGAK